jgi:acyl-CoA synthetase (AMP-forming)/AMP-acid ligase II
LQFKLKPSVHTNHKRPDAIQVTVSRMVYKSPYPLLDIPESNILSYLFPQGQEPLAEEIWIDSRDPSRRLSPKQALQWVKRLSFGLERLGLRKGDVAMICTPNHIFVPVAYLGIVGAGLIFSGANPAYTVPGESTTT